MFAPAQPVTQRWADGLNERQLSAVVHDAGPLLVVAGAGSGKTRTLAARVARLIETGVRPERMLLLTFTRRAAREMLRRADSLLRDAGAARVIGGTFHGAANRLLRRHGKAVGLDPSFTIIDQGDAADLFAIIRADRGLGSGDRRFPRPDTIVAVYSRMVNAQEPLARVLDERFPWCREHAEALRELFAAYTDRKRNQHVLDYDDLLLYWRALLESPAGGAVKAMFDHVLVDEFQDTNHVQGDILFSLAGDDGNLTVVGDDAQAIYSFRAASIENIAGFEDRYAGVSVVTLEQNYRSTPEILDAANAVLAGSDETIPKILWSDRSEGPRPELVTCADEAAQAETICDRILQRREEGVPLREQCVLFRTSHHSAGLEIELGRRDIPFVKFGGLRFLEAAHVKDVLAMLRMVDNPRDELAWHRVLRLVPGIGPATARKIHQRVEGDRLNPIAAFAAADLPLSPESRPAVGELQEAIGDIAAGDHAPGVQSERLLGFCELTFPARYEDPGVRLGDVERLAAMAGDASTRRGFLADLALDPPTSTSALADAPHLDDDYLVLSTIHSAKGGEWKDVYVIHAADGNIPSDMALGEPGGVEEERRLLYVAMTRAKDRLTVTAPQRFYHSRFGVEQAHSYAPLSRFLSGDEVRARFEERTVGGPPGDDGDGGGVVGEDPVRGLLEQLWS